MKRQGGAPGKDVMNVARRMYRSVVPTSVRHSTLVGRAKKKLLGYDCLYDQNYYETWVEGPAVRSAQDIADSIIDEFSVSLVVDVGCSTGALLEEFRGRGCEVFGLEYADAALS